MRAINRYNAAGNAPIRHVLVNTGQHYDWGLAAISFADLEWPSGTRELGIGSGSHGAQTGRMLAGLEEVLLAERPDAVVVYGDTNSTIAGALAASKLCIPVAHVEAGLRSFNRRMAEEINRIVTDHVASWLFCPTADAVDNLAREGITTGVHLTGDVMHESAIEFGARNSGECAPMAACGVTSRQFVLATVHRAENTDDARRLREIATALGAIAQAYPVVWPVHPRTQKTMAQAGIETSHPRLHLIESVSYGDMLALEQHARVILTDSGGVQREAYWFGVPCVTLRDETEWLETVASGWNIVAGSNASAIADAFRSFTTAWKAPAPCAPPQPAADRIVDVIMRVTAGPASSPAVPASGVTHGT